MANASQPPAKKKPKNAGSPKVFDVRRPGKTPANPTSRPVVPPRTSVKDPDVQLDGVGESRQLLSAKRKVTIRPVDADEPTRVATKTSAVASEAAKPKPKPEPAAVAKPTSAQSSADSNTDPAPLPKTQSIDAPGPMATADPSNSDPVPDTAPPSAAPSPSLPPLEEVGEEVGKAAMDANVQAPSLPGDTYRPDAFFADDTLGDTAAPIISEHRASSAAWGVVITVIVVIIFAAIILNLLLDAEYFSLPIPHTNFL